VLQRYPGTPLPSTLVYKLSLALSEASRFGEAEALFPGRFFPREEFGTNVRQVYLEVKLREAAKRKSRLRERHTPRRNSASVSS